MDFNCAESVCRVQIEYIKYFYAYGKQWTKVV